MGVHGLWKLIESSGKPIPVETLENKVLAVDVSIWLHQAIKGFQDNKGAPVANAHLLGIYHRVCKLLYFKIKPVFVFDGGVPALKRQTIEKRNQYKTRNGLEADRLQKQLLSTLLKHSAISKVLSEKTKASLIPPKKTSGKYDNLYNLPSSTEFDSTISSSDDDHEEQEETSATTDSSPTKQWDLHSIDTKSIHFKSLPLEVKHEILTDLKETRKQNSWAKLHQLPKQSDDFSTYQMKRLLKRQEVQSALEKVSEEMGGMSLSLAELESLLKDQGIQLNTDSNVGKRIASDENTRYLLIKDIQKELQKIEEGKTVEEIDSEEQNELKKAKELSLQDAPSTSKYEKTPNKTLEAALEEEEELMKAIQLSLEETPTEKPDKITSGKSKAALEEEEQLKKAIKLSLAETNSTSVNSKTSEYTFLENFQDEDFQSDSDEEYTNAFVCKYEETLTKKLSSAQNYMLEYSGLTPSEIEKIINKNNGAPQPIKINKEGFTNKTTESKLMKMRETEKVDVLHNRVLSSEEHEEGYEMEDLKNNDEVGIMSDSGDSTEDDLAASELAKPAMEIIIDPTKIKDNDDDLFSDIFEEEAGCYKEPKNAKSEIEGKNITSNNEEITVEENPETNLVIHDKPTINIEKQHDSENQEPVNTKNISSNIQSTDETHITSSTNELSVIQRNREILMADNKNETTQNESVTEVRQPMLPKLTINEMEDLKDSLQREKNDLLQEKSRKERLANNITDQMYQEAQELLELFGVPYIVAPMEAEAQCAFLDEIELTDGSITDDSDIWLFGGRTVYKNFFNQNKYVMEFKAENIEHHFKLTRPQLILLALLVGSDYTTGIQGVGPVTALEILASFPPTQEFSVSQHQLISGLKEFKSWFIKGKAPGPGRLALKNKLKNITFADSFPSCQVVEAYLEPKVESSKEKFSWGKPDITGLTVFAKEKFGWTMKKTEEILNPVIKKIEENQTQKSIKDYFQAKFKVIPVDIEGKVSKRVKTAIDRIGKSPDEIISEEMAALENEKERVMKKSKRIYKRKSDQKEKNHDRKKDKNNLEDPSSSHAIDNTKNTLEKEINKDDFLANDVQEHKKGTTKKVVADVPITYRPEKKAGNKKKQKIEKNPDGHKSLEEINDLKDYEKLAIELKNRRKRKNESKIKTEPPKKTKAQTSTEKIPIELQDDEEIKLLSTTTVRSNQKVNEMKQNIVKTLEKVSTNKKIPVHTSNLHTKEIVHQKLRDKSNLLKNKLKAIEVFRKSAKGPGYVPKRNKKNLVPKDDAGLSEEDSD